MAGLGQITPVAVEKMLGDLVGPNVEQVHGGIDPDVRINTYVNSVGQNLVTQSPRKNFPHQFHVLASDKIINAYALGNGHVYITRGLLNQLDNEAQMASVLGHEVGHVGHRHIAKQLDISLGTLGIAELMGGLLARISPKLRLGAMTPAEQKLYDTLFTIYQQIKEVKATAPAGRRGVLGAETAPAPAPTAAEEQSLGSAREIMTGLLTSGFERRHEVEADRSGLKYSAQVGYSPYAIVDVMKKFKAMEGPTDPIMVYFRSHPLAQDRIDQLEDRIHADFPTTVGELGYDRYQDEVHPDRVGSKSYPWYLPVLSIGFALVTGTMLVLYPGPQIRKRHRIAKTSTT